MWLVDLWPPPLWAAWALTLPAVLNAWIWSGPEAACWMVGGLLAGLALGRWPAPQRHPDPGDDRAAPPATEGSTLPILPEEVAQYALATPQALDDDLLTRSEAMLTALEWGDRGVCLRCDAIAGLSDGHRDGCDLEALRGAFGPVAPAASSTVQRDARTDGD